MNDIRCPIYCRTEAERQKRLEAVAWLTGDRAKAEVHIERANRLTIRAAQLEADAAREQQP